MLSDEHEVKYVTHEVYAALWAAIIRRDEEARGRALELWKCEMGVTDEEIAAALKSLGGWVSRGVKAKREEVGDAD